MFKKTTLKKFIPTLLFAILLIGMASTVSSEDFNAGISTCSDLNTEYIIIDD